ncbi:uncharacterized protein [Ptychodera flava]|uniref:uncharacterized protein n=1 Tax=Ptychodera flava TaxID=63121 RepID=UPI00396A4C64
MIDRGPAITKNRIIIVGWSGWSDGLSGILKYEYEVYKMQPYGDVLGYRSIEPIIKDEVDASSSSITMSLTEPADYCVLLTVDDAAGNYINARRFFIFDDVSVVDIDPTGHYPLWVDSASANTSYLWQTNLQDQNCTGPQVVTSWQGHFYNQFQRQNKILNEIEDHSPPLTSHYEEGRGQPPEIRSREAIPNINAIVRFEVDYALDHQGGRSIMTPPGTWRDVDDIMVERQMFDISRIVGDSIRIWVRASDVMGNANTDEILVHIDSTPPLLQDISLERLTLEKSSDYDTTIILNVEISFLAYDDHSGLHTIQWKLIDLSESIVQGNITVTRPKISDCSPPNCGCIPKDNECYGKNYVLQIDRPDDDMPIDIDSDYSVIVSVTNNAMLQTAEQIKIPYCQDTVKNLISSEVTTTTVVITWDEPICPESFVEYQVAINSTKPGDVSSEMTPDNNFTFSRLVEDTEYTVMVKPCFDLKRFGTESRMTVKTLAVIGLVGLHPNREEKQDIGSVELHPNREEKQDTNVVAISVSSTLAIILSVALVAIAVLLWRRYASKKREDDRVRFHKQEQKGKSSKEDLSPPNAAYEDIKEPTISIEQPYSEIAPIGSDETRADNTYETVKTPERRELGHIRAETESEYCQLTSSTLDNSVYTGLSFNKRGKTGRPS